MKDLIKVFASYAAAGAGVIVGLAAGEKVSQKLFKKKSAENKIEEKPEAAK